MKTLKFTPQLKELVLKGEKTTTWRINDEKDINVGDILSLCGKETVKKEPAKKTSSFRLDPSFASFRLTPAKGISIAADKGSEIDLGKNDEFSKAEVISTSMTTFGQLGAKDLEGHEKFKSYKEMIDTYSKYYKIEVKDNTRIKVIKFKLI